MITVIAIMMALLLAFTDVRTDETRQAKNDIAQIVTAVNAFYAEYRQASCSADRNREPTFADDNANNAFFDIRGIPTTEMFRLITPKP